jgi:hypothetical protein
MKIRNVTKALVLALFSTSLVVGCTANQPVKSSTAIDDAKAAIAKNKSVQWIWRDTEKLLKRAEAASAEGDQQKASQLANEARLQAELALQQYYDERSRNRDLVK